MSNKVDIQAKQQEVDNKLWSMANELRGNMDASEFKNYILGLIFYKFLSDKIVKTINDELKDDNLVFETAWDDESMRGDIKKLLTVLSNENVKDLTITEPSLEEIFMHYYES